MQTIRLIFDEPQKPRRVFLVLADAENCRTQEFVVQWSLDIERSSREIVHQQWKFSPPDSVRESEDYLVELSEVKVLELKIVPQCCPIKTRIDSIAYRIRGPGTGR